MKIKKKEIIKIQKSKITKNVLDNIVDSYLSHKILR